MSGPAYPTILQQPFAYAGLKNVIPYASASPNASWHDGFPAVTMEPISSGGVPPAGQDFNGIYYELSEVLVYTNAGGRFKWDSAFAAAVGYPAGAVLAANDFSHSFVCLTAGASTDPNTLANVDNVNWAVWGDNAIGSGNYAIDTGAANAFVIATIPATAQLYKGMAFTFKSAHTNTGGSTLDAGTGALPLVRNDGVALVSGDVLAGSIYTVTYDATTTSFWIDAPVASQYSGGTPESGFGCASQVDATNSVTAGVNPTINSSIIGSNVNAPVGTNYPGFGLVETGFVTCGLKAVVSGIYEVSGRMADNGTPDEPTDGSTVAIFKNNTEVFEGATTGGPWDIPPFLIALVANDVVHIGGFLSDTYTRPHIMSIRMKLVG